MHDANRYRPYSVEKALTLFADDEIGSPQVEVTSLYLNYPDFFRDHGVDASGSRYGDDSVPSLSTFSGRPRVDAYWIDAPRQVWGALSRGKDIILLGT